MARRMCLVLVLLATLVSVPVAHAQEATPTPAPPAGPSAEGIGSAVGNAILGGLGDAIGRMSGAQVLGPLVKGLGWIGQQWLQSAESSVGQTNVLTQWSPDLTVNNPVVAGLHTAGDTLAYSLVAASIAIIGLSLLVQHVDVREALWLLGPRLVLAISLVASAPLWLGQLLALSNGMAAAFGGQQTLHLAATGDGVDPNTTTGALLLLDAVMAFVLLTARLLAHGLFDVLYVLAGPALLAGVLPQTRGYCARWTGLLVSLLVGLPVTAAALRIGSGMLAHTAATPGATTDSSSLLTGGVALSSLLLATMAPGLVGVGVISHGFGAGRLLGRTRQVAALTSGGGAAAASTAAAAAAQAALPAETSTPLENTAPITPLAAPEASQRPVLTEPTAPAAPPALAELAPLEP